MELKRDRLSFGEVVAQSVATIAPSAIPAMIVPLVFASAGNGTWLAFAFGTLVVLFVASNIAVFARRHSSPGSISTFVTLGLGPAWGALAGWTLVIAYFLSAAAVLAGSIHFLEVFLGEVSGWVPVLPLTLGLAAGLTALVVWVSYRDIRLSTRTLLLIEFLAVALISLLLLFAWLRSGQLIDGRQLRLEGVTPGQIREGLIIAFFGFCGFESATVLGGEARDPLRTIPRAVFFTVFAVGIFFTFSAYAEVLNFQRQDRALSGAEFPLSVMARSAGVPWAGTAIAAGVGISFFACTVANINAGARIAFSLARQALLPENLGRVHHRHGSPHVAVLVAAAFVGSAVLGFLSLGFAARDLFDWFATVGTFGTLSAYALVSIAAPVFLHRRGELSARAVAVAGVAAGLLLVPVVGSIYPAPPAPLSYLPYVFLALLALGVIRLAWMRPHSPGKAGFCRRLPSAVQSD